MINKKPKICSKCKKEIDKWIEKKMKLALKSNIDNTYEALYYLRIHLLGCNEKDD